VHPRLRNVLWGLQWGILCAAGLAIGALRAAVKDPPGFGIHHTAILKFVLAAMGLCLLAGSVLGFFRPFARSILEYLFIAALAGLFIVCAFFLLGEFSYSSAALTALFGLLLGFRLWVVRNGSSQRAT
jgi:hypothetical protein